jgi:hypothetical protein
MPKQPIRLPIPEPLRGKELGTFTHSSVVERLPEIAERTLAENDFSPGVASKIKTIITEIPEGKVRLLEDPDAPDSEGWDTYVRAFLNQNWLEVPWFFVEFYFYRRILEATGYFRGGETGFQADPFNLQKRRGLDAAQGLIESLAVMVEERLGADDSNDETFAQLIKIGLWGNQADLSMWPIGEGGEGEARNQDAIVDRILADHTTRIVEHINDLSGVTSRVDIILDNAGFELATDLLLADYLLSTDIAKILYLHPKVYPIFVSDVIPIDLDWTFDLLGASSSKAVRTSIGRLRDYQHQGRLRIKEHTFWTSPLAMWEMPDDLREELEKSNLVFFKGDMNYRRLLGDRHWGYEVSFEEIMAYFPSPVAAIRTLKAEVVCGLKPGQAEDAALQDPAWMVNGNWGVIQFRG